MTATAMASTETATATADRHPTPITMAPSDSAGSHFLIFITINDILIKMIKLSFECSKEFELERIKSTIKRLDWYLNNKYSLNSLSFPKSLDIEKLTSLSDDDLVTAIDREYDEDKYTLNIDSIRQMYELYEAKLEEFIVELGLSPIPEIKIYLTKYGIGGSYHLPNKVIVNIDRFFSIGLIRTVLHEIIHLHIEPLIQKYQIGQWQKETIVNLLFERAFPDIFKKPNIPIETKEIEDIFARSYPNIENIIAKISGDQK